VGVGERGSQAKAGREPPRLAVETIVGGAVAVNHARLRRTQPVRITLVNLLMQMSSNQISAGGGRKWQLTARGEEVELAIHIDLTS
jgi:hypothetical protein